MRYFLPLFILCFSWTNLLVGQTSYFQQQVDYDIEVDLNPATHTLSVRGTLDYTNNSLDALDSIPFHLWANAYSNRESAYAQQKRRFGSARFAFAPEEELGGYRDVDFSAIGLQQIRYENPELCWLRFANPLAPGSSTTIGFTYSLRVPKTFSRMGRDGESYQLTQWFPKPAVYDQQGWHTMPYLDLGEFFCEFGNYKVTITVPENGMVAATGQLVNSEGIQLREARLRATQQDTAAIDSLRFGSGTVTFVFEAEQVHDFAWFVNPRFRVSASPAKLQKQEIQSRVYYQAADAPLWDSAAFYLARAAVFADQTVGDYPYPHISAVAVRLGVGGGMEYPMITAIGKMTTAKDLDIVLAHEAFHNWFQGMLASNERTHPWQDEGLTSWLEGKYTRQHYPSSGDLSDQLPGFLARNVLGNTSSALHAFLASAKRAPCPATHADSVTEIGYGYSAYTQPQGLFDLLEAQLGTSEMEARIANYYKAWSFKHPSPANLHTALGGNEVDWLFEDFIFDSKVPNYAIESVSIEGSTATVALRNKTDVVSPFPLAIQNAAEKYQRSTWLPGFSKDTLVEIELMPGDRRIAIDPAAQTPELKRDDNYYRVTAGTGKKLEPLAVNLLTHFGHGDRNDINIIPTLGYTAADKFMLGVGFHNYTLSTKPTRYYVLPQVSFRDGSLNGMAGLKHSFYARETWWRELQLSFTGRQYHFNYNNTYDYNQRFQRGTAGVDLLFAARPGLPMDHRLRAKAHYVTQKAVQGINAASQLFDVIDNNYTVFDLGYSLDRKDPIQPYTLDVLAQAAQGFGRVSATFDWALRYRATSNFIYLRAFAGTIVRNESPSINARLLPNGTSGFLDRQNDYTYEEFLIDRSTAQETNQYFVRDGSLSLPFLLPVAFSDSWLISTSVAADLPLSLPLLKLQAYLDLALYPDTRESGSETVLPATGGLRAGFFDGLVSVSFPLYNNGFVKESLAFTAFDARYRERIAFRLDLAKANPDNIIRRIRG